MASSSTGLVDGVDAASPNRVDSSCFVKLPFELVLIVITAATHDCVRSSTCWVASLTLVCRAIHHAVDPILVETLRMTDTNCVAVARHKTRFQRTRHINVIDEDSNAGDNGAHRCTKALLQQRFPSLEAVTCFSNSSFTSRSILHMLQDSVAGNLATITHLHIRYFFSFSRDTFADWVPSSVTHLILEPVIAGLVGLQIFVQALSPYLEEHKGGITRLLIRTPFVSVVVKEEFAGAVTGVAVVRRDTRLWMHNDGTLLLDDPLLDKEAATDEDLGLALWYTGRQLYVP
ncbi:hypothetical protein EXIGLDRAFT_736906 [Exidia glandulosa HHB12029]|uniref:F-box domain-containing protein n=1 Tax=Exidia glandulosa HHB12029 TaxID=1314781 RepID=A0A165J9Q8_EXIGL|nr:hypothetical protein EXIGLDRAFT_736906 [Exidia glandulosa HHB12029]